MDAVHVSPYPGAGADWPRCDFCDRAPVAAAKIRQGDGTVTARIPER